MTDIATIEVIVEGPQGPPGESVTVLGASTGAGVFAVGNGGGQWTSSSGIVWNGSTLAITGGLSATGLTWDETTLTISGGIDADGLAWDGSALSITGTLSATGLSWDGSVLEIDGAARAATAAYRRVIPAPVYGTGFIAPNEFHLGGWYVTPDAGPVCGGAGIGADWDGASSYTIFTAAVDFDPAAAGAAMEAGDAVSFSIALDAEASDVVDAVVHPGVRFSYATTHIGIEAADI